MSSPTGQFVLGFLMAFSPAPLVGFGTWSVVTAEEPAPVVEVQSTAEYGTPVDREWADREWSSDPLVLRSDSHDEDTAQYAALPQQEMEIETNCAKRKKVKKRPKPEREIPDF